MWRLCAVGWWRSGRWWRGRGGWSWGLGCLGGLGRGGAAGGGLGVVDGRVGQRAGQVEAAHPAGDWGVERELPRPDRGGGAGGDGERRWGGELPAQSRGFVVHVLGASVVLIGGKKELQGPEGGRKKMLARQENIR